MEHAQLLLLALCATTFWRSDWCELDEVSDSQRKHLRLLAVTATALCLSFMLREMSVKAMGLDWLEYWVDGRGFKILMALIWLPLLVMIGRGWSFYWPLIKVSITGYFAIASLLAASLLVGGGLFDKEIFKPEYFRFYEEVLEMNGYGFLLLAALLFRFDMRKSCIRLDASKVLVKQD